jgi:hypothetical protein
MRWSRSRGDLAGDELTLVAPIGGAAAAGDARRSASAGALAPLQRSPSSDPLSLPPPLVPPPPPTMPLSPAAVPLSSGVPPASLSLSSPPPPVSSSYVGRPSLEVRVAAAAAALCVPIGALDGLLGRMRARWSDADGANGGMGGADGGPAAAAEDAALLAEALSQLRLVQSRLCS